MIKIKNATISKTNGALKTIAIALLFFGFTHGCAIIGLDGINMIGSGGYDSGLYDVQYGSFRVFFLNNLEFDGSLSGSIDNLFSRVKSGDKSPDFFLKLFLRPGYTVVLKDFNVNLSGTDIRHDPNSYAIIFQTDWSPWSSVDDKLLSELSIKSSNARIRGRVLPSDLQFNSLTPNKIYLHAKIEIQLENLEGEDWVPVKMNRSAVDKRVKKTSRNLVNSYNKYLSAEFSIDIQSPKFRSQYEQ